METAVVLEDHAGLDRPTDGRLRRLLSDAHVAQSASGGRAEARRSWLLCHWISEAGSGLFLCRLLEALLGGEQCSFWKRTPWNNCPFLAEDVQPL